MICTVKVCDKPVVARGYCTGHYQRWVKHGTPGNTALTGRILGAENNWNAYTEWDGDCLVWTGSADRGGYGRITVNGKRTGAHRYAWERANGPVPEGMHVDHICWNHACVNIKHLRVITSQQNTMYRSGPNSNSTTELRNVYKQGKGYMVMIKKDRKYKYYGSFSDITKAAEAAEEARKEFGIYAGRG